MDQPEEQLTPEQEQELLRMLSEPAPPHEHREALRELGRARKMSQDVARSLQELEGAVEQYEESLVPSGHHPVHHERIQDE